MKINIKKHTLRILFLSLCAQCIVMYGQSNKSYPKNIQEKINAVENNLAGRIQIESNPTKWSLVERMKFYNANAVSIAVIKDYKIEWAKAYGMADKAEQRPATTNTLLLAGSISKSLNGVGVLKLVQDGKLDLNADINTYLKTWKFPYDSLSKGKKITVANLLSHTAGLNVHGFNGYEQGVEIPNLVQILDGKKPANSDAVRSVFEPSLKFEYSGGGTTILQLIVQDLTGKPYDEFMWNSVLKPMGMVNSSYKQPTSKEKIKLMAAGYYNDGKEVKGKYHVYPEMAAAGLWTNPTDLAKYIIETQLAFEGKSNKVLNQNMTKLRLTPYLNNFCAFGTFINDKGEAKYFTHSGVDEGFVSDYVGSLESGNGVVVMTNTADTNFLEEIINSVAVTYNWKNYFTPEVKKIINIDDRLMTSYSGKYKIGETVLSVERRNDGIYISAEEGKYYKMYFMDNDHFFVLEKDLNLKFETNDSNEVIGITVNNYLAKKMD